MSFNDALAIFIDRAKFYASDAFLTVTQCICKPDATLTINGRSYRIEKLLGEGGFSFVYLVTDNDSHRHYALKKILISSGSAGGENEAVKEAMKEVEAYRRFRHHNIIKLLDCAVVQNQDGNGKIIYLFLPYYSRGNLQDIISRQSVTGERMDERQLLRLFRGTCEAVRAMHQYRLPSVPFTAGQSSSSSGYPPRATTDDSGSMMTLESAAEPLIQSQLDDEDVVFDADEETQTDARGKGKARETVGELIPYAHRDIKPGNIMVADDGSPILMDFGSTVKARIMIENRQQALLQQDIAAEHSTMPYRAPELFDVKTGTTLSEKVDIWSLGCTLFAVAYNYSPFEDPAQGGGSIAMAVSSGRYKHPPHSPYSRAFQLLIDSMLIVDPEQRPDIDKVIELTDGVLATLR